MLKYHQLLLSARITLLFTFIIPLIFALGQFLKNFYLVHTVKVSYFFSSSDNNTTVQQMNITINLVSILTKTCLFNCDLRKAVHLLQLWYKTRLQQKVHLLHFWYMNFAGRCYWQSVNKTQVKYSICSSSKHSSLLSIFPFVSQECVLFFFLFKKKKKSSSFTAVLLFNFLWKHFLFSVWKAWKWNSTTFFNFFWEHVI